MNYNMALAALANHAVDVTSFGSAGGTSSASNTYQRGRVDSAPRRHPQAYNG